MSGAQGEDSSDNSTSNKRPSDVLSPPSSTDSKKNKMADKEELLEKPRWAQDLATKNDISDLLDRFKVQYFDPLKEQVFGQIAKVEKDIQEKIPARIEKMENEFKQSMQFHSSELSDVGKKVSALEKDNSVLCTRINQLHEIIQHERQEKCELKNKIIELEDRQRRDNLVIEGLPEEKGETPKQCEKLARKFLKDTLELPNADNIVIGRVHRVGAPKDNKNRATVIKFDHYKERESVWAKGKGLPNEGVHKVKENFSKESEKARTKLYPIMRAARSKGYYSKLEGHKLIVRDHDKGINLTCTLDTLHQLPKDLDPEKLFTPVKDNVTCYYTLFSPHSSFFPCSFNDEDGYDYNCLEQYYIRKNALSIGDNVLAVKVMGVSDPSVMKSMAKGKFDGLDLDIRQNHLKNGMKLKYGQCERLKTLLKDTLGTTLVESSPYDLTWGSGLRMTHALAHSGNYEGLNLHGKLLSEVRDEFQEEDWD